LEDFLVIHSLVGMHQGDLLTWPIFALAHFHTLWCCEGFPFCIFPSVLDIHIINLAFIIPFFFLAFCFLVGFCGACGPTPQMLCLVTL
jgi:hypothetical protein